MRRTLFLAIPLLALAAGNAHAGYSFADQGVVVSHYADGSGWAWGIPMHARASADANQRVACMVRSWASSTTTGTQYGADVACVAYDASGNYLYCSASADGNSQMASAVESLTPWSQLEFYVDAQGQCTNVIVYNDSSYLPVTAP